MLVQTMTASPTTPRLHVVDESILESLTRQVSELTNRIQELEQKTQEQEQRLQQLEPKPKAIKVVKEPKVVKPKEITLKELKVQAEELGVTDRDVKDQGSKTKKASWQKAIELKIAQQAEILLEETPIQLKQEEEQEQETMISCINPYSVDALNALFILNAASTTETTVEDYPF